MAGLGGDGQDLGDILLVGLEVLLEERVEVQKEELVDSDEPREKVHGEQPDLELFVRLPQARKHLLCQSLRVIEELNCGKIDHLLPLLGVLLLHFLQRGLEHRGAL